MEILFIGLLISAVFLALFAVGWLIATIVMCLHAIINGKSPRPVFNAMLNEW